MKTTPEQRAYSRGYGRGVTRGWRHAEKFIAIARAYRARSETTEDKERRCATCIRWRRGGNNGDCKWGPCAASFEFGTEGRMWPDTLDGERSHDRAIITSEDFGCVNWAPRAALAKGGA